MPNTDTFLCWFAADKPEEGKEITAADPAAAAQGFAKWAWRGKDMRYRPNWMKWDTVVVKHLYTGTVKRFNITREYEPVFSAREVRG